MKNINQQPPNDLLDQATAALRQSETSPGPSRQLVEQTVSSLLSPPEPIRLSFRRKIMFQLARHSKLAAAVMFLTIGAGVFWIVDRSASPAFSQVVENVKKARSAVFTSTQKFGDQPALEFKFYLQDDMLRIELPGKQKMFDAGIPVVEAKILNARSGDVIDINYSKKTVRKFKADEKVAKQFVNPIDAFRKLSDQDAVLIGDEQFNGQKVQVYELKKMHGLLGISGELDKKKGESCKAWVDSKSGLPLKISLEKTPADEKGASSFSLSFENFQWNQKLDGELFAPKIPQGFEVLDKPLTPFEPK